MKHNDNAAVAAFKTNVDRMQDYLTAAGITLPRTHLLEAAARFQGARDWRTLRAELDGPQAPETTVLKAPSLNGRTVSVYFEGKSMSDFFGAPDFCKVEIDQRWVDRVFELRNNCEKLSVASLEAANEYGDWLDPEQKYEVGCEGMTVCRDSFWYSASIDDGDYRAETDNVGIDEFIKVVQECEGDEIVITYDPSMADLLMDILGRDENHPKFIDYNDTQVVFSPNDL